MFIPLFIAILMGLVNATDVQTNTQSNGTIHISSAGLENPGLPTDTVPGDGTGGETGTNPPR